MSKDLKQLLSQHPDWTAEKAGSGHVKLRHPSGALVTVSSSVSDRRGWLNVRADLRRAERLATSR